MTERHDRVGSNVSSHSDIRDSNHGPETGFLTEVYVVFLNLYIQLLE
jgi:hypothetical protein